MATCECATRSGAVALTVSVPYPYNAAIAIGSEMYADKAISICQTAATTLKFPIVIGIVYGIYDTIHDLWTGDNVAHMRDRLRELEKENERLRSNNAQCEQQDQRIGGRGAGIVRSMFPGLHIGGISY